MIVLLATKLHQPSALFKRVQRPHLIQRLNEGLEFGRQITLVSAPAGFGKTTCISEWVNTLDSPATWLSLDPADDDPGRFLAYLVAALQKVDENLGCEIEDLLRAGQIPSNEIVSAILINDILELGGRFLLVLDDLHLIQDRFILQVLGKLVTNLPQPLHLVLITREDPPLPLARLRASNQLTEIRAGDLRFTGHEADRFLSEVMGLSLSPADIAVLDDKTEGWIVGLQLAGLSVRDHADPSRFIATLSGSHRFILSYLTEQVLNRQPDEIQSFLLQTSILDRLSGDLCNAVTGRTDGHALLELLLGANLFLIPLDDEGRWYRYHHLFADLLVNRLQQTLPDDRVQELHGRASEWLAQNDFLDEAVKHALEAKDYETTASLVEREVRSLMFSGRVSTLQKWLEAFPETSLHTHPRLNIYRVWIELLQGKSDLSEQTLQEKENMLRALPPSPENDRLRVELMAILCRFVAFSGNTSRAIRLAKEALACLPEGELALRARAHSTLAIAYGLEGHAQKARQAFDECLPLALATGNYGLAAHATVVMAMAQCDYGQLHKAAWSYQSIVDMGLQAGQKVFFPAGQGYIGLAGIYLEWNDLEKAEDYLERGIELCSHGGLAGISTGYTIKSRLRQARGDLEGALAEIHAAEQTFQGIDPAVAARQILLRLAMGDRNEASRLVLPLMDRLSSEPGTTRLPLLVSESGKVILVRVLLAQGELEQARQLLDEIQTTAEPDRRCGRLIEVHLLRALALQQQNWGAIPPMALTCFVQALALAEPEGYVLLFLEEGPAVIPLLQAVLGHPPATDRVKGYARKLLDASRGYGKPATPHAERPGQVAGLVEPLTPRELQVLHLVAAGDSNRTIAGKLVITVSAVKKHTGNIYGKLNVKSRTQAIARARQLGLFSADE